jgi:membrane peptidoglycan carboxypeptidase
LTLGGGEVRLLELTAAYGALANGGSRVDPVTIREVRRDGEVLLRRRSPDPVRVLDARVAWLITDMLADDAARAPSFGRGSVLGLSRPAGVKTGTTTDWRDNWTIGYTPDLVAGVWVGNADNSPMEQVSGVTGAGPIWHDFMETALLGRPALSFRRPDGLVRREVCTLSGKLPTPYCPHRSVEWFIEGKEPDEADDWYQLLRIDGATGLLADLSTPLERVVEQVFLILPPELQSWAREQGIAAPPPAAADLDRVTTAAAGEGAALSITSPDNGVIYRLSPAIPAGDQQIRLTAVAHVALEQVTFILDDEPIGIASAARGSSSYELRWPLQPGQHRLVAAGQTSVGQELRSEPVLFQVRSVD